jgi:hypothetical protein
MCRQPRGQQQLQRHQPGLLLLLLLFLQVEVPLS